MVYININLPRIIILGTYFKCQKPIVYFNVTSMNKNKITQALILINKNLDLLRQSGSTSKIEFEIYDNMKKKMENLLSNQIYPLTFKEIFLDSSYYVPSSTHDSSENSELRDLLKDISSEYFFFNNDLLNKGKSVIIKYDSNKVPKAIILNGLGCEGDKISYNTLISLIEKRLIKLLNLSLEISAKNKNTAMRELCIYIYQNINIYPRSFTRSIDDLASEVMNSKEFKKYKVKLWHEIRKINIDKISRNSKIPVEYNIIENDSIELFVATLTSTVV
jgi:hypothetical protein